MIVAIYLITVYLILLLITAICKAIYRLWILIKEGQEEKIMKRLVIWIIALIISASIYAFMNKQAKKKTRDLFYWGYWTGIIIMFILDILFSI